MPATLRFAGAPTTQETDWQELVIGHLGLADWEVIELGGELDHLGELACGALRRHGLLWPANAHFHEPLFARAAGGSLLTGLDGDGLLGSSWAPVRAALARPGPVELRAVLRAGLAVAPARVRAARRRRQPLEGLSWLRPAAADHVRRAWADDTAGEPIRWDRRVGWYARRRHLRLGVHSLGLLADAHDTRVSHPLLDPGFLAALAAEGGRGGFGPATTRCATCSATCSPTRCSRAERRPSSGPSSGASAPARSPPPGTAAASTPSSWTRTSCAPCGPLRTRRSTRPRVMQSAWLAGVDASDARGDGAVVEGDGP